MPSGDVRDKICVCVCECQNEKRVYCLKQNAAEIARKTQRPHLESISRYSLEHKPHVSDTRDIPTPNILVEDISVTAFYSMPSGDVRDEFCVCVCEC